MRIDAHQHFWLYDPHKDAWITSEMEKIQRNFLPNDIGQTLKDNGIDGVIAVQADQSLTETTFLLELSQVYALIKGIVGWVDLRSEQVDEHLQHFKQFDKVKGFRHLIESEDDADFLVGDEFMNGIKCLTKHGYTFDLLIRPIHYKSTLQCVAQHPDQIFVLDHLAKPPVRLMEFGEWANFIDQLSGYPNVYAKLSGLLTEANWLNWKVSDFKPYIDHAIKRFGADRLMFGSDWPVCLLAGHYEDNMNLLNESLSSLTADEQAAIWGLNAVKVYKIK